MPDPWIAPAEPGMWLPMRETVRSIAAAYDRGDRVCLKACPDPGTVVEVRCEQGVIQHRVCWDRTPDDDTWYDEADVELLAPRKGHTSAV